MFFSKITQEVMNRLGIHETWWELGGLGKKALHFRHCEIDIFWGQIQQ